MFHRKVLLIGYYGQKNLGDDAFEFALTRFFIKRNIEYSIIGVDQLKYIENDVTAVIFGGGDLVNDYFFQKIQPFIRAKFCPWYAISIGIPYPSLIEKGYLDDFNYIIHRNKIDYEMLKKRYGARVEWFPDMSFLLQDKEGNENRKTKNIGVFLSRHIYESNPNYEKIVNELAKTLSHISKKCGFFKRPTYQIYLYPFCTDGKENHDDRLINKDVFNKIVKYGHLNNVYCMDEIKVGDVKKLFDTFHITICSRFHAHMFSVMSEVPFLSVYTTRKVDNLLDEIGNKKYSYCMKTINDIPQELNSKILLDKFNMIEKDYDEYKNNISILNTKYTKKIKEFKTVLTNLIFDKVKYEDNVIHKVKRIAEILVDELNDLEPNIMDEIIYTNGAIYKYFNSKNSKNKENIAELISFILTNDRYSVYNYGLNEQIFTHEYNLFESCKWIHNDYLSNDFSRVDSTNDFSDSKLLNKVNIIYRKFKLINYSSENYHRSGWNYVMKNLQNFNNPTGILFDSYLDKTFGWESKFLSFARVIPYTEPWIGVFHHTVNTEYSENNLLTCFSNENFIKSLQYCKAIIVLSKNNEKNVKYLLKIANYENVSVISLTHPTEFVSDTFDYKLFKRNSNKKVLQIGAWLRDSYAIYNLNVPKNYQKIALKGEGMENYFIDNVEKLVENIKCFNQENKGNNEQENKGSERNSNCLVKSDKYVNKYIVGLADSVQNKHYSVKVLNKVDNREYDQLLKNNIVFIKLIDASAVNTIIECIVRNTPILVNRLPATEEYLGKDYPLFYNEIVEAEYLLNDRKNIKKAHLYLLNMDKTKFTIEYFLNTLINEF